MIENKNDDANEERPPNNSEISQEMLINFTKLGETYTQVLQKMVQKNLTSEPKIIDPVSIMGPMSEMWSRIFTHPDRLFRYQLQYATNTNNILNNVAMRFAGQDIDPLYLENKKDLRFRDESWRQNIVFDFIKQQYLMTVDWVNEIISEQTEMDPLTNKKISFLLKQFLDAFAPSNFIFSNPEVLRETFNSKGQNLINGLNNLRSDLENNRIKTANSENFEIGANIAITKGSVVYQNELMQLIYYEPTCDKNYQIPILIIPPWINKYYILDLKPQNSMVKWLLDQGYPVFLISWVNPDKSLQHKDFSDYLTEGPIAAIEQIRQNYGENKINVIGYCLGGTLLAVLLGYYKKQEKNYINSATFLTTLIDFSDAGELSLLIDEAQVKNIEKKMKETGVFSGDDMSLTFNLLRANDMIWSFMINNYLLGKEPFPFDILFWNDDSTNLPCKMQLYYLKNMYLYNKLAKSELSILDSKIDLKDIDIPCYFLSCQEDHITPWNSTYKGMNVLKKAKKRFVLSGSGHVAGVINPPIKNKYCYWTNDDIEAEPSHWFQNAQQIAGSWWNDWDRWAAKLSGKMSETKPVVSLKFKVLEFAPGSYVQKKLAN